MPAMALHWLLLGWGLALVVGAVVARWIAKSSAPWVSMTVAVLFIAATVANLFMVPHPQWFNIEVAVVFAALLGLLAVLFRQTTNPR
jgi:predicted MFS family arabinose efflux permease